MNVAELVQSFFGGDNAAKLGQAVGLDAQAAQKALGIGLPMQLDALADHAGTAQGQSQIAEAIQNLPHFGSVQDALNGADGASNLQRAGELLAPALLGGKADGILGAITSQLGGSSAGGIQKLMSMALPLLLSLLGQRGGLNAGNIGSLLGGMKGSLGGLGGLLGAGAAVAGLGGAASNAVSGLAGSVAGGTGGDLLDLIKGQFSGALADKLGSLAGFSGGTAGRATQAALPVLLNAVVNKGKTDAGASELLRLAGQFGHLTDAGGHINANLLNDSAEVGRIETQGRGLLGSLFGNVDEITGRLGTALGGSGTSAGRLLAMAAPLLLSLLGKKAGSAGALGSLLGGLGGNLTSLLPAGLGGLGALLGAGSVAAAAPAVSTPKVSTPAVSTPTASVSRPAVPPTPPVTNSVVTEKRGGIPWWLWLLPLLLLGGCLLFRPKPADTATTTPPATEQPAASDTTTAPAADGTFAISEPAANAELPAGGFALNGTGKAGDELEVFEDGVSLGKVKVGDDGKWTLNVPSPAAGAHTYSVKGPDGAELGTLATTTAAPDANASAANCDKDYTLSIADGQTVNEPFRFGGVGKGEGYSVTVKRGDRTIGTKDIPLDATCGWAYQSKPGAGTVTYEVRPMGDAAAAALSTVTLTVNKQ